MHEREVARGLGRARTAGILVSLRSDGRWAMGDGRWAKMTKPRVNAQRRVTEEADG